MIEIDEMKGAVDLARGSWVKGKEMLREGEPVLETEGKGGGLREAAVGGWR